MKENKITFESKETFRAYNDAEKYLEERGYSVGRMCGSSPTGFKKGNWDIAKWRNLSSSDKKLLDGWIEGEDKREGIITIVFKEEGVGA